MESSDETSCSDCWVELIQKTWTEILLKWLNRCVHPGKKIKILSPTCLSDIMTKYKKDICDNDIDRAILCTDDIEPFIKYKYPILRLRYLDEASDYKKKQYIMTTVLLFHCCIRSQSGIVHADICNRMSQYEQEVILKFCERLDDMEITINNVECAIREAFDYVKYVRNISYNMDPSSSDGVHASTDGSANLSSYAKLAQESSRSSKLPAPSKFNSSITVLPSVVTDTSTYSDLTESESSVRHKKIYSDSDELNLYPIEQRRRKGLIEIEIKQRAKNDCEGPCNVPQRNREIIKGKQFYDPDSDAVQESRDEIIKEPKFKRNKKEEVVKDRQDDTIGVKKTHFWQSKKEYKNELDNSNEIVEKPKYKRFNREEDTKERNDDPVSSNELYYKHAKNEEYKPGCLPGCISPKKLGPKNCPPGCFYPNDKKCSLFDEDISKHDLPERYAESKHAVADDRKRDKQPYVKDMKQGVDGKDQIEKDRLSLDKKQEQDRQSAKLKLGVEKDGDQVDKKPEKLEESATIKHDVEKDGDQVDKKQEQDGEKGKKKVSIEKEGDQVDKKQEQPQEAAKEKVSAEKGEDQVEKKKEQDRLSAKTRLSIEKEGDQVEKKQEQPQEPAKPKSNAKTEEDQADKKQEPPQESGKTKVIVEKGGDQVDKKQEKNKPSADCQCDKGKTKGGDQVEKGGDQVDKKKEKNKPSADCQCDKGNDGDQVKKDRQHDDRCLKKCSCSKCAIGGAWCSDNLEKEICEPDAKKKGKCAKCKEICSNMSTKKKLLITVGILLVVIIIVLASVLPVVLLQDDEPASDKKLERTEKLVLSKYSYQERHIWICKHNLCQTVYHFATDNSFTSLSRCSLACMGPQLWPYPIGYTYFNKKIVALATNRLEYKFQSLPSEAVHQYLAEAFKLFIGDLARLERIGYHGGRKGISEDEGARNASDDLTIKKMNIKIDVESDPEPRLRMNTDESYHLKIETINNQVVIKISSASFCGVRHGLQTLSQMILLDQYSGKLITLSNAVVKDAPIYKYRGLMIDTARNYIPVADLMRNIDAMATVKLNTFHWRISDVTSFPLYLPKIPALFEYGAYDRSMIYTKDDVKYLVNRAAVRGIRVILEVAAPGPVGRAWSWHPEVSCPSKTVNFTCNNILCLRLQLHDSILDILELIYAEILEMTNTDDIFHLSDGIFSISNCFYLIEDRQGFLDKALERLRRANKGFLPKLPIVWHTTHLTKDFEAKTWEQYGVQLTEMPRDPADVLLSKFRVIHSSKWDLSCEINKNRCTKYRTWQEMYSWKSWRNIEVFTVEGGEAILWTDLVNSGNLDSHIWPRTAAVAERLWSDTVVNASAGAPVYVRLDSQRWRMLLNGVNVQPIWPLWCSFNPSKCLEKVR